MIRINLGTEAEVIGTLYDSAQPPNTVDPDTVFGWVRDPNGVVIEYEYGVGTSSTRAIDMAMTRLSQGEYELVFTPDLAGMWYAGFYSTGSIKSASDDVHVSVKTTRRTQPVSPTNC